MAAPPAPRPAPEVQRMKTDAAGGAERSLYLPDFCTSRAALVLILIVELTALVLTLARQSLEGDFWADLSRTSLFLLWIAVGGTALLCLAKKQLVRFSIARSVRGHRRRHRAGLGLRALHRPYGRGLQHGADRLVSAQSAHVSLS